MPEETNYAQEADDDAKEMVEHYLDEIVEQILESGEASNDLYNDYTNGDSYHHEQHVDRHYSLLEAAKLLDQLSSYEETDPGLWQGLEPREAVTAQAAYTYGNAVYSEWQNLIEKINEEAGSLMSELQDERQEKIEDLKERLQTPNLTEQQEELLQEQLEAIEDDGLFHEEIKNKIKRAVAIAAGLKKRRPEGPKEWEPD